MNRILWNAALFTSLTLFHESYFWSFQKQQWFSKWDPGIPRDPEITTHHYHIYLFIIISIYLLLLYYGY